MHAACHTYTYFTYESQPKPLRSTQKMLAEAAKHPCNETLVFCAEKGTIMLYFMAIMQQHMHTPMCFTMENDTNTQCFTTKMTL